MSMPATLKKAACTVMLAGLVSSAAAATRYLDSTFAYITKDTIYGQNVKYNGTVQNLVVRIYLPQSDTLVKRPVLMWMHGGGFTSGSYQDSNCKTICPHFAGRGYVTVSVEYRLGVDTTNGIYNGFVDAGYRAIQDYKAAVRFMRKHAGKYGIDTSKIVIGGASAGGVTAEQYVFWDVHEVPAALRTRLGDFNASGNPGYSDAVGGAVPWAGCVSDTQVVGPIRFPVIALHDIRDNTVPYGYGRGLGLPQLMVYGDGYPAIARQAGGNFKLISFNNGDHIPTGTRYWQWIDSTRINLYNLLLKAAAPTDIAATPAPRSIRSTLPENTAIQAWSLYTLSGQKVRQGLGQANPRALPSGVYLLEVRGTRPQNVRHQKLLVR